MAATKIKGLQLWCRRMTDGYAHVDVANFTTAWRDGMAFCALIHRFRPDLIDYDSLSPENVFDNCKLAFEIAEQELDIPAFLEADDMARLKCPDKLSIITYVSQYYNNLSTLPQLGGPGVRGKVSNKAVTGTKRQTDADHSAAPAVKKPPVTDTKENASPVASRTAPTSVLDKCSICQNRVYLLERHMEGGKLYHRSCFRHSELSPTNKVYTRSPFMSPSLNSETQGFTYPAAASKAQVLSDTDKKSMNSTVNTTAEIKTTISKKAESTGAKHILTDPVIENTKKSKMQLETSLSEDKSKKASEIKEKLKSLKARYSLGSKSDEVPSALPLSGKEARKVEKKREEVLTILRPLDELAKGAKRNIPLILQSDKVTTDSSSDGVRTSTTSSVSSPSLVSLSAETSASNSSAAATTSPSKTSSHSPKSVSTNKAAGVKKHEKHTKDLFSSNKHSRSSLPETLNLQKDSRKSDLDSNTSSKGITPVARPRTPRSDRKGLSEDLVAMKQSLKATSEQKNKDVTPKPAPRRSMLDSPEKATSSGLPKVRKSKLHSEPAVDEVDAVNISSSNNVPPLPLSAPPPLPSSAPPPLSSALPSPFSAPPLLLHISQSHPVGEINSSVSGTGFRKPSYEMTSQEIKTTPHTKKHLENKKNGSSEHIQQDIEHEADPSKSRKHKKHNTHSSKTRALSAAGHLHLKSETVDHATSVTRLKAAPKASDRRWSSPVPTDDKPTAAPAVPIKNENEGQALTGLLATLGLVRNQSSDPSPSSPSRTLRSLSSPSNTFAFEPPVLPPRSNPTTPTRFSSSPKILVNKARPTSPRQSSSPLPDTNINTVSAVQTATNNSECGPCPSSAGRTLRSLSSPSDSSAFEPPSVPPRSRPTTPTRFSSSPKICLNEIRPTSPRKSSSPVPESSMSTVSAFQIGTNESVCGPCLSSPGRTLRSVSSPSDSSAFQPPLVPPRSRPTTPTRFSSSPKIFVNEVRPTSPRKSSSPLPENSIFTVIASSDSIPKSAQCHDPLKQAIIKNVDELKSSKVLHKPKITPINIRDDNLDSDIEGVYLQNLNIKDNDNKSDNIVKKSDSNNGKRSPIPTKRSITSIESMNQISKESALSTSKDLSANSVSSPCAISGHGQSKEDLGTLIHNAASLHRGPSPDIAPQKPPRLHKILKSPNLDNLSTELSQMDRKSHDESLESDSCVSGLNRFPSTSSTSSSQSESVDVEKFQADEELPQWKKDINERKKKLREDIAKSESENVKLKCLKEKGARKVNTDSKSVAQEEINKEYNSSQEEIRKGHQSLQEEESHSSKPGYSSSGSVNECQGRSAIHDAEENVSRIRDKTRENTKPSNGLDFQNEQSAFEPVKKKTVKLKDSELEFMINKSKLKSVNVDMSLEREYEKANNSEKQAEESRGENGSESDTIRNRQRNQSLDGKKDALFESVDLNNTERFKDENGEEKAASSMRNSPKRSIDSFRSQDSQHNSSEDEENRRSSVLSEEKILLQSGDSIDRSRQPSPKVRRKITVLGRNSKEKLNSPPTSPVPMKKVEVIAKFNFEESSSDFESSLTTSTASLTLHDKHVPPPRPPPPRLHHKSVPPAQISAIELQQQLLDLDGRLTELELRGRDLEESIRNENTLEEDDDKLINEWFKLVGERNELVRKEADLAYISREQELEDEQEHIESQLRYLISKPEGLKSADEKQEEEYLIKRKLELVEERNMIIDSMDEDRLRYETEDREFKMMREKGLWRSSSGSPVKEKRSSKSVFYS
ncbi:unnamed protein product [Candidula unifasciata]|uniref:MICAL-like protein 2 n=1 Tax=Candidula unifasciata TaxID=100452 RepID=A0A8S3Z6T4_9EUPU|nr:unnamed protein product [Candidula unifasciata]